MNWGNTAVMAKRSVGKRNTPLGVQTLFLRTPVAGFTPFEKEGVGWFSSTSPAFL